jgi:hypothetical protein
LDLKLDERPGELLLFPRSARLAGAKPDDGVPHPHRLPRPHRQVADDPIALVEQADDRDPLRHGRDARLFGGGPRRFGDHRPRRLLLLILLRAIGLVAAARGGGERQ